MNLFESIKSNLKESRVEPLKVCGRCLQAIESKEGPQDSHIVYDEAICDWCADEVEEYYELDVKDGNMGKIISNEPTVDISKLKLTNGFYHNNSDSIYGKVTVDGEDDSVYSIIYSPESEVLSIFDPDYDVASAVDYLYDNSIDNDAPIMRNGKETTLDDFYETLTEDEVEVPKEVYESIFDTVYNAYFQTPEVFTKVKYQ